MIALISLFILLVFLLGFIFLLWSLLRIGGQSDVRKSRQTDDSSSREKRRG